MAASFFTLASIILLIRVGWLGIFIAILLGKGGSIGKVYQLIRYMQEKSRCEKHFFQDQ